MSHNIDHIFYINLEHRQDRKEEFENEMKIMNLKSERFEAIKCNPGIAGCGYSHLAVLKLAKERKYKNVLIFEDDFTFLVDKETFEKELEKFFEEIKEFDVCMLSYSLVRHESISNITSINKVIEAQTASGYIVHERFYDSLIKLYEEAIPILERTNIHWVYANDQCWKSLQPASLWYAFKTRIGKQRPGYSDNSMSFQDHGI
jgi:GR25 family glycosyltransferase involved in LPS biosynthesis